MAHPSALSLRKAAQGPPRPSGGAVGTGTILLISDGEDTCGAPPPCEVAEPNGSARRASGCGSASWASR
ncbi:hypothetical protein [Streptomyces sp. NPDC048295]|uniref:hypothetical protein n=1 Tax=Streptomyces sp. NPDC048295 TaxID=3154617 RepID=UPI003442693D